jgi:hypothetical protein
VAKFVSALRVAALGMWWSEHLGWRYPKLGARGWAISTLPHTIQRIRRFLVSEAQQRECTYYQTLEEMFPREDGKGWGARHRLMGWVLAVISTESWKEDRVLLSALVLNQEGTPGRGFQSIAKILCKRKVVPEDEQQKVFRRYAR